MSSLRIDSVTNQLADTYQSRFVDRDMIMRYTGIGVGHSYPARLADDEVANAELETFAEEDEDLGVTLHPDDSTVDDGTQVVNDSDNEEEEGDAGERDEEDEDLGEDGDGEVIEDEFDLGPEDGEDGLNGLTSDEMAYMEES